MSLTTNNSICSCIENSEVFSSVKPETVQGRDSFSFCTLEDDILCALVDRALSGKSTLEGMAGPIQEACEEFYRQRLVTNVLDGIDPSRVLALCCLGQFPLGLEAPAKAICAVDQSFARLRDLLGRLSDAERVVLLKQLPPQFRAPLEKEWKMPRSLRLIAMAGTGIAATSSFIKKCGTTCALAVLPAVQSVGSHLLSPVISRKQQEAILSEVREVGGIIRNKMCEEWKAAWSGFHPSVSRTFRPFFEVLFKGLCGHVQITREILQKIDVLTHSIPPRAIAQILFSSLVDFATMEPRSDPTSGQSALSALFQAAKAEQLPSMELNRGLQQLLARDLDPKSVEGEFFYLLNTALAAADMTLPKKQFADFCRKHDLCHIPRDCLLIAEAAFCVKSLSAIPSEIRFLAELVLLDPKCSLINVEKACLKALKELPDSSAATERGNLMLNEHFKKEEFRPKSSLDPIALELRYRCLALLEEDLSPGKKAEIRSALALAEGALKSLFNAQGLIEAVAAYHAKTFLYPQIVQGCLPVDGKILIQALEKMLDCDIHDQLGTSLARSLIQNGLALLTDTLCVASLILNLFGQSTDHLNAWEAPSEFDSRCFPLRRLGGKVELACHAAGEVTKQFENCAAQMPWYKQMIMNGTIHGTGKNLLALSQRADWGLFLIHFITRLSHTIQAPDSTKPFYLTDPSRSAEMHQVISTLFPAIAWIPMPFLSQWLESGDRALQELNYRDAVRCLQDQLWMGQLTCRLSNVLPPSVSAEELCFGLSRHINRLEKTFKQSGKPFHRETYLKSLLAVAPELLPEKLRFQ